MDEPGYFLHRTQSTCIDVSPIIQIDLDLASSDTLKLQLRLSQQSTRYDIADHLGGYWRQGPT
jgi:hypothetical protein